MSLLLDSPKGYWRYSQWHHVLSLHSQDKALFRHRRNHIWHHSQRLHWESLSYRRTITYLAETIEGSLGLDTETYSNIQSGPRSPTRDLFCHGCSDTYHMLRSNGNQFWRETTELGSVSHLFGNPRSAPNGLYFGLYVSLALLYKDQWCSKFTRHYGPFHGRQWQRWLTKPIYYVSDTHLLYNQQSKD